METTAAAVLSRTAECAALLAIGYQLRASRLFSATDAEVGCAAQHCCPTTCQAELLAAPGQL